MLGGVQFNPLFDSRDTYSKETQGMMEFDERKKISVISTPLKTASPRKFLLHEVQKICTISPTC